MSSQWDGASDVTGASQYGRELCVRVVALDYHYCAPVPGLDPTHIPATQEPLGKVAVIRIFGSTPSGQKTCLHVHQVRRAVCA